MEILQEITSKHQHGFIPKRIPAKQARAGLLVFVGVAVGVQSVFEDSPVVKKESHFKSRTKPQNLKLNKCTMKLGQLTRRAVVHFDCCIRLE